METAALKAAGDNRNTPFVRKLANLYTRGTFIEDILFTFDRDIILVLISFTCRMIGLYYFDSIEYILIWEARTP